MALGQILRPHHRKLGQAWSRSSSRDLGSSQWTAVATQQALPHGPAQAQSGPCGLGEGVGRRKEKYSEVKELGPGRSRQKHYAGARPSLPTGENLTAYGQRPRTGPTGEL